MRLRRLAVAATTALLGAACAPRQPPPTFLLPGPDGAAAVARALTAAPLAPAENIRAEPLLSGAHASAAVVQVRDREQPHVHTRYDITVLLAQGQGTLWLDGVARPMRAGDGVFIPRGTPHWFVNDGADPAVAVVVFAPPFSGPDQAPVP
jgi:quercetin dioxygenase-like cupin family protein